MYTCLVTVSTPAPNATAPSIGVDGKHPLLEYVYIHISTPRSTRTMDIDLSAYLPPSAQTGFLPRRYTSFSSTFLGASSRPHEQNAIKNPIEPLFSNDSGSLVEDILLEKVLNSDYGTQTSVGQLTIPKFNLDATPVPTDKKAKEGKAPLAPGRRSALSPKLPTTDNNGYGLQLSTIKVSQYQIQKQEISREDSPPPVRPRQNFSPIPIDLQLRPPLPQLDVSQGANIPTSRGETRRDVPELKLDPPHLLPSLLEPHAEPVPQLYTLTSLKASEAKKQRGKRTTACNHCSARKSRCSAGPRPCLRCCQRGDHYMQTCTDRLSSRIPKPPKELRSTQQVKKGKRLSDASNIHQGEQCRRSPKCRRPNFHPGFCNVGKRQSMQVIRVMAKRRRRGHGLVEVEDGEL
eukprot:92345-Amorphochlora_amoeboformis.AAC.1